MNIQSIEPIEALLVYKTERLGIDSRIMSKTFPISLGSACRFNNKALVHKTMELVKMHLRDTFIVSSFIESKVTGGRPAFGGST